MTVNSRVIKTFLQWSPDAVDVPLLNGLRIQILPTIEDLPRARKHQFAAFVASEALLIVWDDEALHLVQRAKAIESELMELVWKTGDTDEEDKKDPNIGVYEIDEESGEIIPEKRGLHLQNTVLVALTLMLIMTTLGAGARQLAIETDSDGTYLRLALLALTPVQIFFTLFFGQVIVGCLAQIFGPVRQMTENSKFYSARPPPRIQSAVLPHITIQCPVYKEGLSSVIAPTVKSIKQAISTYELQGGSANMFVNDDGMQIIDEEERRARIEFYADHSIGWVARPKHGDNFVRRGKCRCPTNPSHCSIANVILVKKVSCKSSFAFWAPQIFEWWQLPSAERVFGCCVVPHSMGSIVVTSPMAWNFAYCPSKRPSITRSYMLTIFLGIQHELWLAYLLHGRREAGFNPTSCRLDPSRRGSSIRTMPEGSTGRKWTCLGRWKHSCWGLHLAEYVFLADNVNHHVCSNRN